MIEIDPTTGDDHRVICAAIEGVRLTRPVDHVITDPPYAKKTQDNTRTMRGGNKDGASGSPLAIRFEPANVERRKRWASWIAQNTRRWSAVFSDDASAMLWADELEACGMAHVRVMPWLRVHDDEVTEAPVRSSGTPQLNGMCPAQGWEAIVLCHARGARMRWHGGGKVGVYTAPVVRGADRLHETQKPLSLMLDILRDFCDPGETIADPFAGSGTTAVAAKQLGMRSLSIEMNQKHADYARRRVASASRL